MTSRPKKYGEEWINAPERTEEELGQVLIMYLERIKRHVEKMAWIPQAVARLEYEVRMLEKRDRMRRDTGKLDSAKVS